MNISDLILELQTLRKKYGDVAVNVFDNDMCTAGPHFVIDEVDGEVNAIIMCDYESSLSFVDGEE